MGEFFHGKYLIIQLSIREITQSISIYHEKILVQIRAQFRQIPELHHAYYTLCLNVRKRFRNSQLENTNNTIS